MILSYHVYLMKNSVFSFLFLPPSFLLSAKYELAHVLALSIKSMNCIPSRRYVEILTFSIGECDFTWK